MTHESEEKENSRRTHETGHPRCRHRSLCRTVLHERKSQGGSTANTKSVAGHHTLPYRSAGDIAISAQIATYCQLVQLVCNGIVHARQRPPNRLGGGFFSAPERSCCPPATCTSSSRCAELAPLHCRITADLQLLFTPVLQLCRRSLRDPRHLWSERLASSAISTPGSTLSAHPHVHCVLARRSRSATTPAGSQIAPSILPSGQKCSACLPAASLRRRTQNRPSCRALLVPRTSSYACEPRTFASWLRVYFSVTTGRLLQTALRRARTCAAAISRLHPPFAISNSRWLLSRRQRNFSLARLRSRQQEKAMTLPVEEFLRRSSSTCCRAFMRIRNFGFLG